MSAYLFVHFREKTTPDGEQVYFTVSKDGFHWKEVNGGTPVLWNYVGTHGVRDFTIVRNELTHKFYIVATDLSIAYGTRAKYPEGFWDHAGHSGSTKLVIWESEDLVNWSTPRLAEMGPQFGCCWAPDILFDKKEQNYVVHWSSCLKDDAPRFKKAIYYSRTVNFVDFTPAEVLYEEPQEMIDSAMYEENDRYHLFVKHEGRGCRIALYQSDTITGPFVRNDNFDESMLQIEAGLYEAPTAVKLDDGRWSLFLDYYGARGADQGYVPFLSNDIEEGFFERSDASFEFPYNLKHGTILKITEEEYDRILNHDWSDKGYVPEDFV